MFACGLMWLIACLTIAWRGPILQHFSALGSFCAIVKGVQVVYYSRMLCVIYWKASKEVEISAVSFLFDLKSENLWLLLSLAFSCIPFSYSWEQDLPFFWTGSSSRWRGCGLVFLRMMTRLWRFGGMRYHVLDIFMSTISKHGSVKPYIIQQTYERKWYCCWICLLIL